MEAIQITALVTFLVIIGLIIWGKLDRAVLGIIGVALMVFLGVASVEKAFMFVDWNVIGILFAIWIIATYFGKTGVPQYLAVFMLKISRGNIALFLVLMGVIASFISMFVDNVVVILMMAPVILHVTKRLNLPSFPFIIFLALGANFMGTALLLGDLPPQMLHSVSGIEFPEFIWQMGRPSSFFILTVTFLAAAYLLYLFKFKRMYAKVAIDKTALAEITEVNPAEHIADKPFAYVVLAGFLGTILAMSFRQAIGLPLGFIAISGMITLVLIIEMFHKKLASPTVEEVLAELDWRALLFYVTLFSLVGAIDHVGIIKMIADAMAPFIAGNIILGTSILYWVTIPIVGIVEHDAYILVFLYLIRDIAASTGVSPWPLYWGLLWAGTLGSNLTVAGAPALFVALNICEKEDTCKIGLKEFFSYTVPFVFITEIICYILALFVWIIPFA